MEAAMRDLAPRIGIELVDIKFGCCPAPTGVKAVHFDAWLALAARNLCLVEREGLDVFTLCSGCTNTLRETNHILAQDERKRLFVHDILERSGKEYQGKIKVYHVADLLARDEFLDRIAENLQRPLTGLRVATHYGCHYFRPAEIMFDEPPDPANPLPIAMERILDTLGADVIPYNRQELCCGAALGINTGMNEQALQITAEKIEWMNHAGIDALATTCPTCFTQFDSGQALLARKNKGMRTFPVYHITELTAYALGSDVARLHLKSHKIAAKLSR